MYYILSILYFTIVVKHNRYMRIGVRNIASLIKDICEYTLETSFSNRPPSTN